MTIEVPLDVSVGLSAYAHRQALLRYELANHFEQSWRTGSMTEPADNNGEDADIDGDEGDGEDAGSEGITV